jgi:hypothetical protein
MWSAEYGTEEAKKTSGVLDDGRNSFFLIRVPRSAFRDQFNRDASSFRFPQAQAGISQANLDWVAKRGDRQNFDFFPFKQSKLIQALHEARFPGDSQYLSPRSGAKFA